jgi:hypothetical protein
VGQEQVFISYRRDDSAGYARALHDALARRFGAARIFIDVDDIAAGQRFAQVIAGAVERAQVLLVLIGPRWPGGAPRRAAVNGRWIAEVVYPWPNARYDERFELAGEGAGLRGSASYLGLPHGIVQGRVEGERVQFETRTQEIDGSLERVVTHRYEGRLDGERLALTLRSARAGVDDPPLDIVARREGAPPPAPR